MSGFEWVRRTRYRNEVMVCSVCGAESTHRVLVSISPFDEDGPDLDGRPSDGIRATMEHWIHECPVCGVVAPNLEQESPVTEQWLKQKNYKRCDGIRFKSKLAKRFYRYYKILLFAGDHEAAFREIRCATWACDGVGDEKNARYCRLLALDELEQFMEESEIEEQLWVIKADFLRRTEQFEKVINLGECISLSDNYQNRLLSFEVEKARENDSACYWSGDVILLDKRRRCEAILGAPGMSDKEWSECLKQLQFENYKKERTMPQCH